MARDITVSFRTTTQLRERLHAEAAQAGVPMGAWLRACLSIVLNDPELLSRVKAEGNAQRGRRGPSGP